MDFPGPAYRVVIVLGMLAGALAVVLLRVGSPSPAVERPASASAAASPVDVLHTWDEQRSSAYAAGDATALAALYVPGSVAGRNDVRLLGDYARRGLRIGAMTTQVFSVRVLAQRSDVVRLRVVERLVGGVLMSKLRCLRLPRGQAAERVVELRRIDGLWRVASVA